MAVEPDPTAVLPDPPPPRPARREATVDLALRRFDGSKPAPPIALPRRRSWARTHRPQFAALVTACLLLIIGIPAVMLGLREVPQPARVTPEMHYDAPQPVAPQMPAAPVASPAAKMAAPVAPTPGASPVRVATPRQRAPQTSLVANDTPSGELAVSAPAASAPPPPPPPTAPVAEREAAGQDLVVTGTRIAERGVSAFERVPSAKTGRTASGANSSGARAGATERAYTAFLARLQAAVRTDDRRAITALIGYPLQVNFAGRASIYRDAAAVERDYERIFTPAVRRAILAQRVGALFVRDQGAMIGDGKVWFDRTCPTSACDPAGPVRIKAVNP